MSFWVLGDSSPPPSILLSCAKHPLLVSVKVTFHGIFFGFGLHSPSCYVQDHLRSKLAPDSSLLRVYICNWGQLDKMQQLLSGQFGAGSSPLPGLITLVNKIEKVGWCMGYFNWFYQFRCHRYLNEKPFFPISSIFPAILGFSGHFWGLWEKFSDCT